MRLVFEGIFIGIIALFLFTIGLSHQEIIGFDSRFYLFAKEMWQQGITWFPTTYGEPYPDYPVTSTLLIYFFAKIFGGLNKLTAVLPSAMAASLTLMFTYWIGSLRDKRYGLCASIFLLLTLMFVQSARGISLDMYPTLITAACFYILESATLQQRPQKIGWVYPLLLIGFAFRGPIGLIIPQSVISIYYLIHREYKKFLISGFFAILLLIVGMSLLLMAAYQAGGHDFVMRVIHMEVAGRINNTYQPFYFYFTTGFRDYAFMFPFAVLGFLGILSYRSSSATFLYLLTLIGWMLMILIGMSIPGDKKIRYILPAAPAFCLLAAYVYLMPRGRYLQILQRIITVFLMCIPLLLAAGLVALSSFQKQHAVSFSITYFNVMSYLVLLQVASVTAWMLLYSSKMWRRCVVAGIAALSFMLIQVQVIESIEQQIDRARDFVTRVEQQRQAVNAMLVFYRERPDALPIKYLVNMPAEIQPVFIEDLSDLMQKHHVVVLTSEDAFQRLPIAWQTQIKIIARGRMAHVGVVVFMIN